LEFKIRGIDLLNELAGKRVQGLALRCSIDEVSEIFIESLEKLCKKNSGNSNLKLYVHDETGIQTELLARSQRIKVSNGLIKELKSLVEVGILTDKSETRWLTETVQKTAGPEKTEVGTFSPTFMLEWNIFTYLYVRTSRLTNTL